MDYTESTVKMPELLNPGSEEQEGKLLDRLSSKITEVSTLPHIALRVMEVANNKDTGASDLREILEGEPALSSRVLKCVNSAAYGLREKVTSLQRAISYLGFKQVRNLAITASVSDLFKTDNHIGSYNRTGLWRHLVAVGLCSRMIAMRLRLPVFEEAFLAGLLHDIGIILEDQYSHDDFSLIVNSLSPDTTLVAMEQEVQGFDHTMLGYRIANQWKFPDETLVAIKHHHQFLKYNGPHTTILACVVVANMICSMKDITSVGVQQLRPSRAAIDALRFGRDDLKVIASDLDQEMDQSKQLFDLLFNNESAII